MSCTQHTQLELSITGEAVRSAVKSFTLSKRYTQIMVRASILNILYRRMYVTNSCLKTKKYEDIPFVVFKNIKHVKDPLLNNYLSWINGIKDAIDKNYLTEIFVFMKNDVEVLETYRFALKYNTEQNSENKRTLKYVKDDTVALFQVICDLGKIEKLSRDTKLEIEFTYSDTTPFDYEPPGFVPAKQPICLQTATCDVHLATLNTGYHKLTCRAKGLMIDERALTPLPTSIPVDDDDDKENMDVDDLTIDVDQEVDTNTKKDFSPNKKIIVHEEIIILDDNDRGVKKAATSGKNKFNTSNITISDCLDDHNVTILSNDSCRTVPTAAAALDCVCQLPLPIKTAVIGCGDCGRRCHVPCCGFFRDDDAVGADFRCNRCNSTDRIMATFSASDANLLAIIRLILYFLNKTKTLPSDIIELIDESRKKMIFLKLKEFNIYTVDAGTKNGLFNRENLEAVVPLFFNTDNSQFFH